MLAVKTTRAMVEALADGVVTDKADTQRYLRLILQETQHLSRLIDDLFIAHQGIRQERLRELLGHTPIEVIAGALLGAIYGAPSIPFQWRQAILTCRPQQGMAGVTQPRPLAFWPCDALWLAERLATRG